MPSLPVIVSLPPRAKMMSFSAPPSKLSSPLIEMPTPVPNPSTYSLHDGSGATWNFPGGTPLTDLFIEEEIAYAQANPPTDDEVLEYTHSS